MHKEANQRTNEYKIVCNPQAESTSSKKEAKCYAVCREKVHGCKADLSIDNTEEVNSPWSGDGAVLRHFGLCAHVSLRRHHVKRSNL